MTWFELRCADCIEASRYSKILLKYTGGVVSTGGGEIAVLCKCGRTERLTWSNQSGDGVSTFAVGAFRPIKHDDLGV